MVVLSEILLVSLFLVAFTTTKSHFFYRNDININESIDINSWTNINELSVLMSNEKFCVYDGINVTLSVGFNAGNGGYSLFGLMSSLAIAFKSTQSLQSSSLIH